MKKRLPLLLCLLALALGLGVSARAAEAPTSKQRNLIAELAVMGTDLKARLKADPTLGYAYVDENGRTMVPLRALAETMGLTVSYDGATGNITIQGGTGGTVVFRVGSAAYTVGGAAKQMDTAPAVFDGRTHVPVRFAVESLGGSVEAYNKLNGGSALAVIVYFGRDNAEPTAPAWAKDDYVVFPNSNAYLPGNWETILALREKAAAGKDVKSEVSALYNGVGAVNFRYDAGLLYECLLIEAQGAAKGGAPVTGIFQWNSSYSQIGLDARRSLERWSLRALAAGQTGTNNTLLNGMRTLIQGGGGDFPLAWSGRQAWKDGVDRGALYAEKWFDGVRKDYRFQIQAGPQVLYDGFSIQPNFAPYKSGDTLMIDLPTLCRGLGYTYEQVGQTLVMKRDVPEKTEIRILMGSSSASVNGTMMPMGHAAEVRRAGDHSFAAVPITLVTGVLGQRVDYDAAHDMYFVHRAEDFGSSNLRGWLLGMCALGAKPLSEDACLVGLRARFITTTGMAEPGKEAEYASGTVLLRRELEEDWACAGAGEIRARVEELTAAARDSAHPAWELFQAAQLASRGYGAEYLSLEELCELAKPAAQALRAAYGGWDAACADYIEGYKASPGATEWKSGQLPKDYRALKEAQAWAGTLFDDGLFTRDVA